jgi:hypothetical protein
MPGRGGQLEIRRALLTSLKTFLMRFGAAQVRLAV